jgi:hypothetical protein
MGASTFPCGVDLVIWPVSVVGEACLGGEAVNLVVHDDVDKVEIAAHGMDEVADADAVAIAAGDYHFQVRIGEPDSGSDGNGAAVQRVHAVTGA